MKPRQPVSLRLRPVAWERAEAGLMAMTTSGANSGRAFWKMRGPERTCASLFFREGAFLILAGSGTE